MHINAKRVIETRIADSMGFNKYRQIMERVRNTDVSSDEDFQRTFNSYYRIRRNEEWQAIYYDLFETMKDSQPSFEQIIRTLYKNSGNIEAYHVIKISFTKPDPRLPEACRSCFRTTCQFQWAHKFFVTSEILLWDRVGEMSHV